MYGKITKVKSEFIGVGESLCDLMALEDGKLASFDCLCNSPLRFPK